MSRATYTRGSIGRSGKLLGLAALASLLVLSAAYAQTKGTPGDDRGLRLVTLAPIPAASNNSTGGGMYSFDISYVDSITGNYYLADRSNRVVDFVDSIGRYVTGIPASPAFAGFTGSNSTSGPNGVVAAFPWLFATDANSRVVTIDLRNNSTVSNASTGGAPGLRADELAYDPTHGVLLVVNNADGDGRADLIFQSNDNRFFVSASTGSGFTAPVQWMQHGGSFIAGEAQYADVNRDGLADLIFQSNDNRFFVSLSTGSSFTAPAQWMQHGGTFTAGQAQYADVNGDGVPDLIFQSNDNRFFVSLQNSGSSSFSAPVQWMQHGGSFIAGQAQYADVNGDGRYDLLFQGNDNKEFLSVSTGSSFGVPTIVADFGAYGPFQPGTLHV